VDDATGAVLPYEVDHWGADGGDVWVRLPFLDGGTTLSLTSGPGLGADAGQVWEGWELVHHFQPGLKSSADGRYPASLVGLGEVQPGIVGDAPLFSTAGDDRVEFAGSEALFDGWSAFTLAFWLYADYPSLSAITTEPQFLDKGGSLNGGRLLGPGNGSRYQIDMHFTGTQNDTYDGSGYEVRRWIFAVYTFDGARLRVYVDGAADGATTMNGGNQTLLPSNDPFYLGGRFQGMRGSVDELWIDRRARDARWVYAVNRSVRRQLATVSPSPAP
jgi:hypothetical protein